MMLGLLSVSGRFSTTHPTDSDLVGYMVMDEAERVIEKIMVRSTENTKN